MAVLVNKLMKHSYSSYKKPRSAVEINLAPLIDMMFLLVIFFMVSTVFPEDEQGVVISKPRIGSPDLLPSNPITIKISDEGRYFMEGGEVTIDEAIRRVTFAISRNPERMLILEADLNSRTGAVVKALDRFKSAGVKSMAIAAEKSEP